MKSLRERVICGSGQFRLASALLASVSLASWLMSNPTAFEWPAIDLAPLLMSWDSPHVLSSDFFTQSSQIPNPRWVFAGWIYGLALLFQSHWYTIFFVMKGVLVAASPLAYFWFLRRLTSPFTRQKGKTNLTLWLTFLGVVILLIPDVRNELSVAWWKPMRFDVHPSTVATVLPLLAFSISDRATVQTAAVVIATLLHPAVGLMVAFAGSVASIVIQPLRFSTLMPFLGAVIAAVVVWVIFSRFSSVDLPAEEFVRIYVKEGHPFHYLYTAFGDLGMLSTWVVFAAISFVLALETAILFRSDKQRAANVMAVLTVTYVAAMIAQVVFVGIVPVKAVAMLGPVRFTFLGYLLAGLGLLLILADGKRGRALSTERPNATEAMLALVVVIVFVRPFLDDPWERIPANSDLKKWAVTKTAPDSVFVLPHHAERAEFSVATKRAVIFGNGFPFVESAFAEYAERQMSVDGTFEEWKQIGGDWIGEKVDRHYYRIPPNDMVGVAKKYDAHYVVRSLRFAPITEEGRNVQLQWRRITDASVVFRDDVWIVYDVKALGNHLASQTGS